MREDKNFSRRMVLNKFSNTPPFYMKSDNTKKIPPPPKYNEQQCQECEDIGCSETPLDIKVPDKTRNMYNSASNNNNTSKGNKILDNFKKVEPRHYLSTPNVQPNIPRSKLNQSKTPKFGKNIPNHNMMNILLENLLEDDTVQISQNIDQLQSNEMYIEINHGSLLRRKPSINVISNNMQKYMLNTHERQNHSPPNCQNQCNRTCNTTDNKNIRNVCKVKRVDQKTSTTGLHWVPENNCRKNNRRNQLTCCNPQQQQPPQQPSRYGKERMKCHLNNSNMCKHEGGKGDFLPTKGIHRRNRNHAPEPVEILDSSSQTNIIEYINPNVYNSYSSEFENVPTKDVTTRRKKSLKRCTKLERPSRTSGPKLAPNCDAWQDNTLKPEKLDRNPQVKPPHEPVKIKERSFVRVQVDKYNKMVGQSQTKKKKQKSTSFQNSSNENVGQSNNDYCQFMNSVKEKVPTILNSDVDQYDDDHEWSDCPNELNVTFPKETRNAMRRLMENRQSFSNESRDSSKEYISNPEEDYPSLKPNCRKLTVLPCHKNLLCNRGFHDGACIR